MHLTLAPFMFFFFFNDTATTEIYTLSLHDALPIIILTARRSNAECSRQRQPTRRPRAAVNRFLVYGRPPGSAQLDRKSTRLNSSHGYISYAVFCLKKKRNGHQHLIRQLTACLPVR